MGSMGSSGLARAACLLLLISRSVASASTPGEDHRRKSERDLVEGWRLSLHKTPVSRQAMTLCAPSQALRAFVPTLL